MSNDDAPDPSTSALDVAGILSRLENHVETLPAGRQVENAAERIEKMRGDRDHFGNEWIPFSLGNLTRELALRFEQLGNYDGALEWIRTAEDIWRACAKVAPTAENEEKLGHVPRHRE